MSDCADCGGSGSDLKVADSSKGCCTYSIKTPCLTCQRVVPYALVLAVDALLDAMASNAAPMVLAYALKQISTVTLSADLFSDLLAARQEVKS